MKVRRCEQAAPSADMTFGHAMRIYCSDGVGRCRLAAGHSGPHLIHRDGVNDFWAWQNGEIAGDAGEDVYVNHELTYMRILPHEAQARIKKEGPR